MRDFTLAKYVQLLEALRKAGYRFVPVRDFLSQRNPSPCVILRHDVDRREGRALAMALLEKDLGIQATYYFRVGRGRPQPELVRRVRTLGHEVGYHYEVLSKARGDREAARKIFVDELCRLREVAEVQTAAMHGSPLSQWNNLSFWEGLCPQDFGLEGEAYLSFGDRSQTLYLSDTGRGWNSGENLRDWFPQGGPVMLGPFSSTDEVIHFLAEKTGEQVYLLVHPNRWTSGPVCWLLQRGEDSCANWLKRRLKKRLSTRS